MTIFVPAIDLGDDELVRWLGWTWCFALALISTGCATSVPTPARVPSSRPPAERVEAVLPLVEAAARRHGLEVPLVLGLIQVESGFDPRSRSSVGAAGLMQLMPGTAAALARRLGRQDAAIDEPGFNIEAGCLYLELLRRRFDGDLELTLAAYNTGPYRVAAWRAAGRPLPDSSRRYVEAVLAARRVFAEGRDSSAWMAAIRAGSARASRQPEPDRAGLRVLLRQQQNRYPERAELPPSSAPTSRPADQRPDDRLEELQASE